MAKKQHWLSFRTPLAMPHWNSHRKLWYVSVLGILVLTACLAAAAAALLMSRLLMECWRSTDDRLIGGNSQNAGIFSMDPLLGRWDAQHKYKMFDHVLVGSRFTELSASYSVCLATQSSVDRLDSLVHVAHNWKGPISVALFAAGDLEFRILQRLVDFLRQCYVPIRERISFHLAFPKGKLNATSHVEKSSKLRCKDLRDVMIDLNHEFHYSLFRGRGRSRVDLYPQNHLRNLARKNCQTPKVFLTDIDIVPSRTLADDLNKFFETENCKSLCAYVIPTYEKSAWVSFPNNKVELVKLARLNATMPYHHSTLRINTQYATNYSRWEQDRRDDSVHVSHKVTNYETLYEPFYVADDVVPQHDERFIGYGYTRNTQVREMYVAGYEFFVLSPVFAMHLEDTTHSGGPRLKNRWGLWRRRQNDENRQKLNQFVSEILARYPKGPPQAQSSNISSNKQG